MVSYAAYICSDISCILGESPVWHEDEQALIWVDLAASCAYVHNLGRGGEIPPKIILPQYPAGLLPTTEKSWDLVLAGSSIYARKRPGGELHRLLELDNPNAALRFNENKVDPMGRLWFSTMVNNLKEGNICGPKLGKLYFSADLQSYKILEEGIGIANTMAWSPAKDRFYFGDTAQKTIFSYDCNLQLAKISGKNSFFQSSMSPDGSAIDVEGCLWTAFWGSSCVRRLSPQGQVIAEIPLPVKQPTSVAFGGAQMQTLFITSAKMGTNEADAGKLFAAEVGVAGQKIPKLCLPSELLRGSEEQKV